MPNTDFQQFESRPRDFRIFLQQEFVSRCRRNPKYSLRAFARSLGVEPSPLSAILRGKRPISARMKKRLGLAMGLTLEALAKFDMAGELAPEFQQIALDTYSIIADWYHYAILELTKVVEFTPDLASIAKTLAISKTEAGIAIERLQRVGLLEVRDGKWVDKSQNGRLTNINGALTSQASKNLQKQILEMSIRALEELPTSERNHTSMTMAIDPDDLEEAKIKIQTFRRQLCAFFERNKRPTRVYHLNVSLYPVSGGDKK